MRSKELTILIYRNMHLIGGIQSIVKRCVREMVAQGQEVFVLCDLRMDINGLPKDRLLSIDENDHLSKLKEKLPIEEYTLKIVALSPDSAAFGFLLAKSARANFCLSSIRMAVCVYHPRDFMRETEKRHVHILNKILAYTVGARKIVFMNKQCRETHQQFLGIDLSSNAIVPVPIDARARSWIPSQNKELRLVSVGRIVSFKAYIFTLPQVISELNARGISIKCDIFGYGEDVGRLMKAIEVYGAGALVNFCGPLELDEFDNKISKYDLFVGMGTAAVQAAQLGVPTIVSIVDDPTGAHGFFDAVPFGNLGENDAQIQRHDLTSLLEKFALMSLDERNAVSAECSVAANRYVSIGYVDQLIRGVDQWDGRLKYIKSIYCYFYIWMAQLNWLRRLVRRATCLVRFKF